MAIHRLYIDEFEAINYSLIAIHTDLEDFRLAYFINKNLTVNLKKNRQDISINTANGETHFSSFIFEDFKKNLSFNLFENMNKIEIESDEKFDLFAETALTNFKNVYLLPEFKKVDYFLKIDHLNAINENEIINSLKEISQIVTVYNIEIEKIKNKNNLIF